MRQEPVLSPVLAMKRDEPDQIATSGAILFPHSFLSEGARRRLLAAFSFISVCKPWYMDEAVSPEGDSDVIRVVRPPKALRPPQDFPRLLAEYRLWMSQNQGCGLMVSEMGEEATWDIRRAIRQGDGRPRTKGGEDALKWHLILHLYRELEESRLMADELLLHMRSKQSPLAEAIGESFPTTGVLDDLPVGGSYPAVGEGRLGQVIQAWFGLFGPSVPKEAVLVTLTSEVLVWAAERFGLSPPVHPDEGGGRAPLTIQLPRGSDKARMEGDASYAGLSGKRLVLIKGL